jgi:hypothetical protein
MVPFFKPIIAKIDSVNHNHSNANTYTQQTASNTQTCRPPRRKQRKQRRNQLNPLNMILKTTMTPFMTSLTSASRPMADDSASSEGSSTPSMHPSQHFITLATSHMRDIHTFIQNGGGHVTNLSHLSHAPHHARGVATPLTTSCTHSNFFHSSNIQSERYSSQ